MDGVIGAGFALLDVETAEIGHFRLDLAFDDIDVDDCLLVTDCNDEVPVALVLFDEVTDDSTLLQLDL